MGPKQPGLVVLCFCLQSKYCVQTLYVDFYIFCPITMWRWEINGCTLLNFKFSQEYFHVSHLMLKAIKFAFFYLSGATKPYHHRCSMHNCTSREIINWLTMHSKNPQAAIIKRTVDIHFFFIRSPFFRRSLDVLFFLAI